MCIYVYLDTFIYTEICNSTYLCTHLTVGSTYKYMPFMHIHIYIYGKRENGRLDWRPDWSLKELFGPRDPRILDFGIQEPPRCFGIPHVRVLEVPRDFDRAQMNICVARGGLKLFVVAQNGLLRAHLYPQDLLSVPFYR